MPRSNRRALARVADVAAAQHGLITSAQLAEIGLHDSSLRHRIRQGGPWRRVLPGVYLVAPGALDEEGRRLAARLYVGAPCLTTGGVALQLHGVTAGARATPGRVHVLIPETRRRSTAEWVTVERTSRMPVPVRVRGEDVAPVARAAIDACRRLRRRGDVEAILTEVVRSGRASTADLFGELARAQRRGTALARESLRLIERGPASPAEAELYRRWTESDLPAAEWNVDLFTPQGEFLARPDVYVPELGVVVELDSREHHYDERDWERTMRRDTRLTAYGLVVLHVTPARVRDDWDGVVRDVLAVIGTAARRPTPLVEIRRRRT